MKKILLITLFFSVFGFVSKSNAQIEKLKSAFIYNFAKGTEWPASSKTGDFIVGVLGKSDVTPELQKIAGARTIGAQKIALKEFSTVAEISSCHILFIPEGSSKLLPDALTKVGNTLVITEKAGLITSGAAINFVLQDSKLRFELNKANAESRQLKISGTLEKMAL